MSNLTGRNFFGATAVMAGGLTGRQRVVGAEPPRADRSTSRQGGIRAISKLLLIFVRPSWVGGDTITTEIESQPLPKEAGVIASRVTTANPPHAQ